MMEKKFQQPAMAKAFKEAQKKNDTSELFELLDEYVQKRNAEILENETIEKTAEELRRAEAWSLERYDTGMKILNKLYKAKIMARHYAETENRPEYLAFYIKGILLETFTALRGWKIYRPEDEYLFKEIIRNQYVIVFTILDNMISAENSPHVYD